MKQIFLLCLLFFSILCKAQSKEEGLQKVKIQNIKFEGNKITREIILTRELTIKVGDSILEKNVELVGKINARNIFNLLLFRNVNYAVNRIDSNTIEYSFEVKERGRFVYSPILELADRNINVWLNDYNASLRRLNYGARFSINNILGRNQLLKCTTQTGFRNYIELNYSIPQIDKKQKSGLGFKFTYAGGRQFFYDINKNKQEFLHTENLNLYNRFTYQLDYIYRHKVLQSHMFSVALTQWNINDTVQKLNPNFFPRNTLNYTLPELFYTYNYSRVDDYNFPTKGEQAKITTGLRGFLFDKDYGQLYTQVYFSQFYSFNKILLAFINRSRIATNKQQAFILNRALGFGSENIRGYEYYLIDGSSYFIQRADLRYKLLQKAKHSHKFLDRYMPLVVYPKIYADAGYVKGLNYNNGFLNNKLLVGYGIGLEFYIRNAMRLRIEYTLNNTSQRALYLHTTPE